MVDPWLVRTIDNRVRVKWRDEATILQDADFDTEADARAFGLREVRRPRSQVSARLGNVVASCRPIDEGEPRHVAGGGDGGGRHQRTCVETDG